MNSFHWCQGTRGELSHSEQVVLAPGDRPIEGDPGAGQAGNINEIYINYSDYKLIYIYKLYILVIYIYMYSLYVYIYISDIYIYRYSLYIYY